MKNIIFIFLFSIVSLSSILIYTYYHESVHVQIYDSYMEGQTRINLNLNGGEAVLSNYTPKYDFSWRDSKALNLMNEVVSYNNMYIMFGMFGCTLLISFVLMNLRLNG